jgi:hypothetical protein
MLDLLSQFARSYQEDLPRPASHEVVRALLMAERDTRRQRSRFALPLLWGQWNLAFVAGKKTKLKGDLVVGSGFGVPKWTGAQISFAPANNDRIEIGNRVSVGLVQFNLSGPARYLDRKNILAFDFTNIQMGLLGTTVYRGAMPSRKTDREDFYTQSIANQAFFAFFHIGDDFIAARGRGGGLALWVKN